MEGCLRWAVRVPAGTYDSVSSFWQTPGYPCFAAGIFGLFGVNIYVISFLQVILSSLTSVLIYFIAGSAFNKKTGAAAETSRCIQSKKMKAASALIFSCAALSFISYPWGAQRIRATDYRMLGVAMAQEGMYLQAIEPLEKSLQFLLLARENKPGSFYCSSGRSPEPGMRTVKTCRGNDPPARFKTTDKQGKTPCRKIRWCP